MPATVKKEKETLGAKIRIQIVSLNILEYFYKFTLVNLLDEASQGNMKINK